MALKVGSSSSPSIVGEQGHLEHVKDKKNKSSPIVSHANTMATQPMPVADFVART